MSLYWNNLESIQKLQDILNQDRVAIVSGDTVLGLVGRLNQKSYEQLNEIKNRFDKPYLILIRSVELLPYFIDQELTEHLKNLILAAWPGPVTLIFKARQDLPHFMKSADGTIALRVPDHKGLQKLLQLYDGLFSTSANIHTEPIPQSIDELNPAIVAKVGMQCYQEGVKKYPIVPSTILDCSAGSIKVVRKGCCLSDYVKKIIDLIV